MKNFGFIVLFMLMAGGNAHSQGQWTKYTVENGLPDNYIRSIAMNQEDELLISLGDLQGVWKFSNGKFSKAYSSEDGLIYDNVNLIKLQNNNILWFGSTKGLSRYDGVKWTSYNETNGLKYNSVIDLCFGPDGKVWCATFKEIGNTPYCAISSFNGSEWKSYSTEDSLRGNYNRLRSIAVDKKGIVWMGTGYGLLSFDGSNWKRYTTADGLKADAIYFVETSPEGNVFVGNANGYNIINDSEFDYINFPKSFFGSNLIYFLSEDNFWVGYSDGFSEYNKGKWTIYDYSTGFDFITDAYSLIIDRSGILWIGSDNGLLSYNPNILSIKENEPNNLNLLQIYPNPFNSSTTINFKLEESGYTEVNIYSITGQLIKNITSSYFTAGSHNLTWEGSDKYGTKVASGTYVFSIKNGESIFHCKTTYLK